MSVLVLNLGLKSIRSIVFDENGNKLSFANSSISTKIKGNMVTQSPHEWLNKAFQVIKKSVEDREIKSTIRAITVTASSSCLVPVNKFGDPLYEAIMVSDKRAVEESEYISRINEFKTVADLTSLNSDPYLMLPKILWFKKNEPDLFEQTYKFLSPNDFFIYKFTNEFVTDELNAHKYHYLSHEQTYPVNLLKVLEIPTEKLPKVAKPGDYIGKLSSLLCENLGINHTVGVFISTYDAICAFVGSGPQNIGEACDVSGTVSSLRVFSKKEVFDNRNRIINTPLPSLDLHIVGGSNNLGGGLIEWVKQCYYSKEDYPYEVMEMEANQSTAGANGIIFLPYLMGERAPIWDVDARGVYFGLERTHTRKDLTRSVFESTGFAIMSIIEILENHDVAVDKIRLSGGLSRIQLISQIKADITGKEIIVVDEFETTALGAAILTWIGMGRYKSIFDVNNEIVKERLLIFPNEKRFQIYQEMYNLYKDTYDSLKDLFKERTKITNRIYRNKQEIMENL